MEKQIIIYDGDCVLTYLETEEKKQQLWDRMIEFCKKHDSSTGESVQNDDFVIDAPNFVGSIIDDVIKFDVKFKD